jgi:hypothetical protein
LVDSTLSGATNNYGFRGSLSSAVGRWNVYMDGNASNYFAGKVQVGSTTDGGELLQVTGTARITGATAIGGALTGSSTAQFQKIGIGSAASATSFILSNVNATGGTSINGWRAVFQAQSDVTSRLNGVGIALGTQATTFTISDLVAYNAEMSSIGAGSTITRLSGFNVDSSFTGGTSTYGFSSNIASGTGRWNAYMGGTASNYFNGNVQIGSTTPTAGAEKLQVTGSVSITGTTGIGGALAVTGAVTGSSTATFAKLNIGTPTGSPVRNVSFSAAITGSTTSYSNFNEGVVQSDVTTNAIYFGTIASTLAASFTLTNLIHYRTAQSTIGVGSAVTNQYGFVATSSLIGATNNYGFYSDLASAANRWNFYANGTSANYFNGNVQIGSTTPTAGAEKLQVTGTASVSGALSIGNTVATAVSVASTHKVTIVIGGVTYYLLATNV